MRDHVLSPILTAFAYRDPTPVESTTSCTQSNANATCDQSFTVSAELASPDPWTVNPVA
jgi:hypothetical protein